MRERVEKILATRAHGVARNGHGSGSFCENSTEFLVCRLLIHGREEQKCVV